MLVPAACPVSVLSHPVFLVGTEEKAELTISKKAEQT